MFSMRLACVLAVTGTLAYAAACSTSPDGTTFSHGNKGGDDDDDDDDSAKTTDGGSSSSSSGGGSVIDTGPPRSTLTFFVSSLPAGDAGAGILGGNLGGLTGADKKCQDLATAVNAGDHTWKAYLSATGTNAKDRIGPGPWMNQKGAVIAPSLAALHNPGNAGNPDIASDKLVDEKGAPVPDTGRFILTGSKADGTPSGKDCSGWTSADKAQSTSFGDATPENNSVLGSQWNYAYNNAINNNTSNCTPDGLKGAHSEGRIFCFATD